MKRIYHLTIVYDSEKEEIEYLMESVDEECESQLTLIGMSDTEDYFEDEELLKMIDACCEPGEA